MNTTDHWKLPRLYCDHPIATHTNITLGTDQTHYLKNVMRRNEGDNIRIFNDQNGEYLTTISTLTKKETTLTVIEQIKQQHTITHRTHLIFTPLAKNRMDILIEKSVELGVTDLHPILTNRTEHRKIKAERLQAQIIEASEQCERINLPTLHPLTTLPALIETWTQTPTIQWCSERSAGKRQILGHNSDTNQAFLIGPVGGFTPAENKHLQDNPLITPLSLGDDILRAETASLLALSSRKIQLLCS